MKQIMKKLLSNMWSRIRRARGEKKVEIKILGIQLLLIAKPGAHNWNIFVLYIPLLRVDISPKSVGMNLLLFTWIYKALRNLFTKWEITKSKNSVQLRFCGVPLYRRTEVTPWRFPSAMFHG